MPEFNPEGVGISERLRQERERLGLKVKDMTTALSLSRNMWSRYEKGSIPDARILTQCISLGFDVAYILTGHRALTFVTPAEALLLARFRAASPNAQQDALSLLGQPL